MVLIPWEERYALGIPDVDHEHRELIDLINGLHAKLGGATAGPAVLDVLGEIHARIAGHFALEERIMREAGYEFYAEHKADHERLLDEIRDIMDAYEDQAEFDEAALAASLRDWFAVHFQTQDARLHKHLA